MAGIAAASELNERHRFRGFYRTEASSEFIAPALAVMARQFNWTQMAIISQDGSLSSRVSDTNAVFFKTNPSNFHPCADYGEFGFHIQI